MNLKNLFRMNYMTILLQTIVLVIWVFFAFPAVIGFAGLQFNIVDPAMFAGAMFSGLMVSVMTFKLMQYRKGY